MTDITVTDPLVTVTGGPIDLGPGESDTTTFIAVYVITQDDINIGFVENQAIVDAQNPNGDIISDTSDDPTDTTDVDPDGDGNPDDITITDLPMLARLSLIKSGQIIDIDGDGSIEDGEVIQYTFVVTNTGNVPVFDITIEDPLVEVTGGPIDLEPGESDTTTFSASYILTEEDIEAGIVINQATAIGEDLEGNEVSDISDTGVDAAGDVIDNPEEVETPNDGNAGNVNGDATDDPTVLIFDGVLAVSDVEIFNGISPDGDGINDYLIIEGINRFPDNTLTIFNRWGVEVYSKEGYDNDPATSFSGISNGRTTIAQGEGLPTGTYYYILQYQIPEGGVRQKAGYLYINK